MAGYGNSPCVADRPHLFRGWCQYTYIIPGSFLVRVSDELPSEVAVITEIMAVTVGLDRAKPDVCLFSEVFLFDDTVVVLGVGPLGLCSLMKARNRSWKYHRRGSFRFSFAVCQAPGCGLIPSNPMKVVAVSAFLRQSRVR
jgi:hypothetical protein